MGLLHECASITVEQVFQSGLAATSSHRGHAAKWQLRKSLSAFVIENEMQRFHRQHKNEAA
jgi:hypothetical protein